MTFSERFPHAYLRLDFYANVGVLAFDACFLIFLLWDLFAARRAPQILTRLGTASLITGILGYRLYLVWALWHFHAATLSHQRIAADLLVIGANIIFIICLVADYVLECRRKPKDDSLYSLDPPNSTGDVTFRKN